MINEFNYEPFCMVLVGTIVTILLLKLFGVL